MVVCSLVGIQGHDWSESIQAVLKMLDPWEASSALCFVLSEVEEEYLTIEKEVCCCWDHSLAEGRGSKMRFPRYC